MGFKRELNVPSFIAASSSQIKWYTLWFFFFFWCMAITSPQNAVSSCQTCGCSSCFRWPLNSILGDTTHRQETGILIVRKQSVVCSLCDRSRGFGLEGASACLCLGADLRRFCCEYFRTAAMILSITCNRVMLCCHTEVVCRGNLNQGGKKVRGPWHLQPFG